MGNINEIAGPAHSRSISYRAPGPPAPNQFGPAMMGLRSGARLVLSCSSRLLCLLLSFVFGGFFYFFFPSLPPFLLLSHNRSGEIRSRDLGIWLAILVIWSGALSPIGVPVPQIYSPDLSEKTIGQLISTKTACPSVRCLYMWLPFILTCKENSRTERIRIRIHSGSHQLRVKD